MKLFNENDGVLYLVIEPFGDMFQITPKGTVEVVFTPETKYELAHFSNSLSIWPCLDNRDLKWEVFGDLVE